MFSRCEWGIRQSSSRRRECTCLLQPGFHCWTNNLLTILSLCKGRVSTKKLLVKEWNWLSHSWGTGSESWQGVWILSNAHFLISHCLASAKRERFLDIYTPMSRWLVWDQCCLIWSVVHWEQPFNYFLHAL